MRTVTMLENQFLILFPYTPLDVDRIRTLAAHKWHPEKRDLGKPWSCAPSLGNLKLLRSWKFEIDPSVEIWERGETGMQAAIASKRPLQILGFKGVLRPFQEDGVRFLDAMKGRALIGDEMGLGKTVQALAWLCTDVRETMPALILCPASLKNNWEMEVLKFTDKKPYVLEGTTPYKQFALRYPSRGMSIINYDLLIKRVSKDADKKSRKEHASGWVKALSSKYKTIILDECHQLKNAKAKRTKAAQDLCFTMPHVIALSGTPILNKPIEFFTTLNLIAPEIFNNYWKYGMRYCAPKNNGFGWQFTGATHTEELHEKLKRVMIRRLKKDVLKELPEKIRTYIPISLGKYALQYDETLRDIFGSWSFERPDPMGDIRVIARIRQAAVAAKLPLCLSWVDDFLEEPDNGKLVLFVVHHSSMDALAEKYPDAIFMDDRVPVKNRQALVNDFQKNPKRRLLITTIKVGGQGHNITAARTVAFLEFPWTPGEMLQGEDRVHRIGQDKATNIFYLVGTGTIEEDMLELLTEKGKVLDAVLDGKSILNTKNIQQVLIDRMKKRKEFFK